MPFNGSGTYTLPAGNPVTTGTTISSTTTNNTNSDIATALTNCLTRDGQSTPSANLPMNSKKLTGLAAGTTNGDSVRYEQITSFITTSSTDTLTNKDLSSGTNTFPTSLATLTGAQTLTNKDLSSGTNTFPTSLVTLTGAQVLTNKTLTGYTETVYTLSGTDINPANGTIQTKTLAANTTFTESIADGQSVVLMLNPATYTTTWPTITWINTAGSGSAPTLKASATNVIVLWQVATTVYGNWLGSN